MDCSFPEALNQTAKSGHLGRRLGVPGREGHPLVTVKFFVGSELALSVVSEESHYKR